MAAKKMTASKKSPAKKPTAKRPPRQVWLTIDEGASEPDGGVYLTKKAAKEGADRDTRDGYPSRAIGPYVLAERAAER